MTLPQSSSVLKNRSQIMRNALWYLAAGLGGHAYVLVSLPLLQRTLSASEFGVYIILAQVAMFLQMVNTALFGSAILRLRVEYEGVRQKSFLSTVLASAIAIQGLVWALLAWRGEAILTTIYPNLTPDLGFIPTLLGAWALLMTLRNLTTTLIKSLEQPKQALILNVLHGVTLLITLWVMLVARPDLTGKPGNLNEVFWALIFAEATATLTLGFFLRHHLSLSVRISHLRTVLTFSSPLVLGSMLFAIVLNLDGVILARNVDLETQGVYGFGAVLGKVSAAVVTAYISSYSARLINSSASQSVSETSALLRGIMADNLVLLGAFTCAVLLSAETIITVMMSNPIDHNGTDMSATGLAVWSLAAICVGNLSRSVFQVFSNTLFVLKKTWLMLALNVTLLAITALAMILGVMVSGAAGLASAFAISYVILSFIAARPARRQFKWNFPWRHGLRTAIAVGVGLAGTAAIWQLGWSMSNAEFWGVKAIQGLVFFTFLPALIALRPIRTVPSE